MNNNNNNNQAVDMSKDQDNETQKSYNYNSNINEPIQEPSNFELDIFGEDDNEIMQLINEESLWNTNLVIETEDKNSSIKVESELLNNDILQKNNDKLKQLKKNVESKDLNSINNNEIDAEDIVEMFPDAPDFSMDELPIFSKEHIDQPNKNAILEKNDDSKEVEIQQTTESLKSNQADLLDPTDLQFDAESLQTSEDKDNTNSKTIDSSAQSTSRIPIRKISLRQRNAIQLHPFTLEHVQFRNLISKSALKGKINDAQLIDIQPDDEILASQYVPPEEQTLNIKHKTKRTSAPSKNAKRKQTKQLPTLSEEKFELDLDTQDLEKYGLDHLILPSSLKEKSNKKKNKIITFDKKKGSRKKRSTARKPLRFSNPLNKDIFAFDINPQSNFNLTAASSARTQPKTNDVSITKAKTANDLETPGADIFDFDTSYSLSTSTTTSDNEDDNGSDDDMDEPQLNFSYRLRNKRHLGLNSSDEDDVEMENSSEQHKKNRELTKKELDDMFKYPSTLSKLSSIKRLPRKPNHDNDAIPVIADEFEYRENKRRRIRLKDMIKKKKLLKSVLPASFVKIYKKELLEEDKLLKSEKQSSKSAMKSTTKSTTSTNVSGSSSVLEASKAIKDNEISTISFESQSDEEDKSSDDMQDLYTTTMDDYVIKLDTQSIKDSNLSHIKSNELYIPPRYSFTSRRNIFSKDDDSSKDTRKNMTIQAGTNQTSSNIPTSFVNSDANNTVFQASNISVNSNQLHPDNRLDVIYPLMKRNTSMDNLHEEPIEDNRVRGFGYRTSSSNKKNPRSGKSKSRNNAKKITPKSSIAIEKPTNITSSTVQSISIRNNPAPQRRRKRPKRCKDDIYIHAPSRIWNDRSGQMPDTNRRMFFKDFDHLPRKAFDDIYVGTQHTARYTLVDNYKGSSLTSAIEDPLQMKGHIIDIKANLPLVYSLQSVVKRIKHLYDYDLQRIKGLKDTVYLHHQLLAPLLSATPNLKSAYRKFRKTYAELNLFKKHLLWTNITMEESHIIDYMFFKVSRDILLACSNKKDNEKDLPGHDYFYTFVSICLTQWIPLHAYESRIQLTELFMIHIRSLAWQILRLVDEYSQLTLPWRSIVKLLIYILDWTCRLHHLGVHPIDWSVTECTQIIMDILVYIGYESIRFNSNTKDYLVEAWIFLIQIMSVSSKESGYYFYEQVFIDQLMDSIKRKSRASDSYEFEKRKTTRLWAETLNYILDTYMM
ncbi:uncharacterized protein BX663DRAFT_517202 [Cokeromyces recurvatus]|uniref:uncharacterized protein n=1 Tax=Cokeromyces recurvatus TaxID=90255 RepID=UPI0022203129|nr:uncharacterized protein BX663DRAFT_517202 [Cokeromyces recurvatus]KAI7900671.1 hypothetical protein BX663DRAFT_517202 [Cokeromyces recurvatus]